MEKVLLKSYEYNFNLIGILANSNEQELTLIADSAI